MPCCRMTQAQCCNWRPTWLSPPLLASSRAASLADMSQHAWVRVSGCCAPEGKHAQQIKLLCDSQLAAAGLTLLHYGLLPHGARCGPDFSRASQVRHNSCVQVA